MTLLIVLVHLTRAGPGRGGGAFRRPLRFFANSDKTAYLFIHPFRTLPESFGPRSSQFRSPGQVKLPNPKTICDYAVTTVLNGSK